ncbi:Pheophytinase [Forsythia ovata]|uniref:Pheophytinase n=1 Tax=Forsythia ovata TaxID=205694 RepID=A0ABD1QQV8_9LAMI
MEIISCCHVVNFVGIKDLNSRCTKLPVVKGKLLFRVVVRTGCGSSRYSHSHSLRLKRLNRCQPSRTVCSRNSYENVDSIFLSENYNSYVLDGEEDVISVTGRGKSVPKVLIPGLPDDSNGDSVAPISSCYWEWKPKLNVHYEKSGSENLDSPPVLFLPGFGVGSFHYEKQLKDLGRDYRAWALDFLGQGMSLPSEDPTLRRKDGNGSMLDGENNVWGFGDESETWAEELVYSVDLWRDQVRYFVEEVIKEPVYLVGNSLGGSPRLSKLFPWSGTFPLPSSVRKLMEVLWQKVSDPRSIEEILKQVYADHSTKVDGVFSRIIETTQHPAAAASFASIMFAPRGQLSFNEALSRCQINDIPICLMYGKEDPWVRPIWGFQVKSQLQEAPFYEISPAGHCPHDEVPEVVNFLLRGWIKNLESHGSVALPLLDNPEKVNYDVRADLEFAREGSRKSVRVQYHGSGFSLWSWLSSRFKPLLERGINSIK